MFFLALRYLWSRKKQTFLIIFGILLGSTAYVVISGMMVGFQQHIITQLVDNDAHIRISSREDFLTEHGLDRDFFGNIAHVFWISPPSGRKDSARIEYPHGWFERMDSDPDVFAYSPQVTSQVLMRRASVLRAARLIGCDPRKQLKVTNIASYMVEGKFEDIGQSGNRMIVGDGLLQKLGARVSETVLVSMGTETVTPFKIVGVFHGGIKSIDDSTAFAALADAQRVNQTPSVITDIAVRLTDVKDAQKVATQWAALSRDKVQSWDQANEGVLSIFKTQDFVRVLMTVSILLVAGFGIYNVLNMMVSHKKREIAILRSMGYEQRDILHLFLIQGLILGAAGGIAGLAIGFFLCHYIATVPVSPERMISGPGGYMPMSYAVSIYISGFALAFGSSVIASFLPARSAGKLTPIEIIRTENA